MLRCWKTWIDIFKQTPFVLTTSKASANLVFVLLICICALAQPSHAQQSVLQSHSLTESAPVELGSASGSSSARIISGMIQFEPAKPIRQPSNPGLPLAERSHVDNTPTLAPTLGGQNFGRQNFGLRSQPVQNRISQSGYQSNAVAPSYPPNTRARSIPNSLVPPGSAAGQGSPFPQSNYINPGYGYQPNRMAYRQDEDPFGESQPQRPRGNNRNPFGDRPQEGRINPFADPPQNNIVPPGGFQETPRRDPFIDPPSQIPRDPSSPRETAPRQEDYQSPRLPGNIPDYGPFDQELPIPDPRRNGYDNGYENEQPPRNDLPTRGRPIRRAPTTHYGPSRRGQFQDPNDAGIQSDYFAGGYQNNYENQNGYGNYREPYNRPSFEATQYEGIVDRVGLDGYCSSCLEQPYSCCEPLFYISIFGGYSDADLDGLALERGVTTPTSGQYELDDGYGFGIAIGQTQGANLRTELEFSFRSNDAETFELNNANDLDLSGDVSSSSGMFNFAWDFNNIQAIPRFRPYVGAGIGFSYVDADDVGVDASTGAALHTDDFESDSAFAWQVFTGVTYQYSTAMNLFIEYRYFDVSGLDLESQPDASTTLLGDLDYQVDNVFVGFRLRF